MTFHNRFMRYSFCFITFILFASSIKLMVEYDITCNEEFAIAASKGVEVMDKRDNRQDLMKNINSNERGHSCLPCEVVFDVYKYGFCLDVPDYYHNESPAYYDKTIHYFNTIALVNYTKVKKCWQDDMVLYINTLDSRFMDAFWIVS